MRFLIVLALCLCAAVAEELNDRGVDFHKLHYDQHWQTLEEARKKMLVALDGQHADFEEVGSYGGGGGVGVGEVGVGTVGLSSSNSAGGEYGSSSGSNVGLSSSAGSQFGASHSANFASSSSYGSDAKFASGSYGSAGYRSGSLGGSSLLLPIVGEIGSTSHSESSASSGSLADQKSLLHYHSINKFGTSELVPCYGNTHVSNVASTAVRPIHSTSGSVNSVDHHERLTPISLPNIQFAPSTSGFDKHFHHEERRVQNQDVPIIQFTAPIGGSENYIHHEERRVQNQDVPIIQFTAPIGGAEKYVHHEERHVQNQDIPVFQFPTSVGGQESYMKYHKQTTTASQPQISVQNIPSTSSIYQHHQSTAGTLTGSQLTPVVTGGLSGSTSNYNRGYYGLNALPVPTYTLDNSKSTFKSNHDSSVQAGSKFGMNSAFSTGHQTGIGASSAHTNAASFGSTSAASSAFGASGSTTGLTSYMQESERLAKEQVHGMSVGGARTGGSQYGTNFESSNTAGYNGYSGPSGRGVGITGAGQYNTDFGNAGSFNGLHTLTEEDGARYGGYKTKSWEKASKWSSQSELGADGVVNNFKELSTGQSENYDINGHRAGYKAATTTLDDNGKVSTYSLHT